jgi:dolichol-phosphate mannosyltransferase
MTPFLSFVVPVYGSPGTLAPLHDRIRAVCTRMGRSYEIILVDDRCPHGSWPVVRRLVGESREVVGLRLSRNFGQHAAINAGLTHARGDWIVVLDCDLQDQPEEVEKLLARAISGGFDVVRARRSNRNDSLLRRALSRLFYAVLSLLTGTHQSAEIANFGVYNRKVVRALNQWQEQSKYFPAIVEWIGFSQDAIDVAHAPRPEGRSSYTLLKLAQLGTNVIVGFSDKPLRMIVLFGLAIAFGSFCVAVAIVSLRLLGLITIEGWASVMISLWFICGCVLATLGIIGLYVGRILSETKGRPTFVIDEAALPPPAERAQ